MEYGVVVNNKFALFDDEDEDPMEVLQRTEEAKAAQMKSKTAAKENTAVSKSNVAAKNAKNTTKTAKVETKSSTKVLAPVQEQKSKTTPANQPPRRDNVAEKPPRFRQNENQQRRAPTEENRDIQRTEFRADRTDQRGFGRRGRGVGRGGANEGGFDRFGKREFERHSGSDRTGVRPVEKREGGGAHNWGTIADAVAEQEQLAANPATLDTTTDADTTAAPTGEDQPADAETANVEEERQMTLDEWKAMQKQERAKPLVNLRKPGEGCQTAPEWKKMVVLKKKLEDDEDEEEEEYDEEFHSRPKHMVDIPIRFNDAPTRGGAGFRGRGRGGPGGPGTRRPANESGEWQQRSDKTDAVPNVDNELDFPSLA